MKKQKGNKKLKKYTSWIDDCPKSKTQLQWHLDDPQVKIYIAEIYNVDKLDDLDPSHSTQWAKMRKIGTVSGFVGYYKTKKDAELALRDAMATMIDEQTKRIPYFADMHRSKKMPDLFNRSIAYLIKLWNKAMEVDDIGLPSLTYNIEQFEPHFGSYMIGRMLERQGTLDDGLPIETADQMDFWHKGRKTPRIQILPGPRTKFLKDVYSLVSSKRAKTYRQREYDFILNKLKGFKRDALAWKNRFAPRYKRDGSVAEGWTYYRVNLVEKETKISKAEYEKGRKK